MKQVPLAYFLMSGKSKEDYKAVLQAAVECAGQTQVAEVVMDFKAAMWHGVKVVFPEIQIRGCVFHWVQAMWRRVQALGLQDSYSKDEGTHCIVRMLMALPFIPHEHVLRVFLHVSSSSNSQNSQLASLCTYIHDTWISSRVWPYVLMCLIKWINLLI